MSVVVKGKNDLHTWCIENNRKDILEEWDYTVNSITPEMIARATNKTYAWKCRKCGYRWKANANSRTRKRGIGCPVCSGKVPRVGINDFETLYPGLVKQWSTRNARKPSEYTAKSAQKVWWKGSCGHEWQDTIAHRTGRGSSCPFCYNQVRTSFSEQAIFFYVKKYYPDAINGDKTILNGKELDIYIPSKNAAVEYDGQAWHENIEKDEAKNKLCAAKGICLYRIREKKCWFWEETSYLRLLSCSANSIEELQDAIRMLLFDLSDNPFLDYDVDIHRDEIAIRNGFVRKKEGDSLESLFPNLAAEWHPTKNQNILPNMVTPQSRMRAWWCGKCGHEWMAKVYSRTREAGSGCPYCSQPARRLLKGFNDFETKYPHLAKEWDYSKNRFGPNEVLCGNSSKYWWICPVCGFHYQAAPSHRCNGTGCPKCGRVKTNESKFVSVENVDTGEIFVSIKEACEKYNLKAGNIAKCCKGLRKTTGGYRWKYH